MGDPLVEFCFYTYSILYLLFQFGGVDVVLYKITCMQYFDKVAICLFFYMVDSIFNFISFNQGSFFSFQVPSFV